MGCIIWNSIEEVFDALNRNCTYLVLRNYEKLYDSIYINGHEDVDILCSDLKRSISTLGATLRAEEDDGVHYNIDVGSKKVKIDIRTIGDGYYDKKWEKDMLASRKMYGQDFYVMSSEDYFYSLIYHAIFHKREFACDYKNRLISMAEQLGIFVDSKEGLVALLEKYMFENGYGYTNSSDYSLFLNYKAVNKKLLNLKFQWSIGKWFWRVARKVHLIAKV